MRGPGGSSLPSWKENDSSEYFDVEKIKSEAEAAYRLKYPSLPRLVIPISTGSGQVLSRRANISVPSASPPPAALPIHAGLTVTGLGHIATHLEQLMFIESL